MQNPLADDLDHVLAHTTGLWDELRGERLFITGGTGFFGCWLLESFAWANDNLGLNATAVVLTRNWEAFRRRAPHLASHHAIQFHIGDVRSFQFPVESYSYIIHAATESNLKLNEEHPTLIFDTIVEGTRHTLEFAHHCGTRKFLFVSSGAVYGKQPFEITRIPEDYKGVLDTLDLQSTYGEGKRAAELLCAFYAKQFGIETKIARCFAFVGPYLPLDAHFAIANFIRDGLSGTSIKIKGDGSPYRSYLYASDMAVWLWTILFRGKPCFPYNVGSDVEITIFDVASLVADQFEPRPRIEITTNPTVSHSAGRYIPSTQRARQDLGLHSIVRLPEAVKRTLDWFYLVQREVTG
ncbi:MAG: NAD-dependent epimerase/dehydratase family protein [Chloroflexi bacterium]|uniref:NAD-dependent epimerase/dehydratase family protein n=1 Tax=Candidatus Wunengus sp. YC65 TaxID=3367701 RepID=UPI0040263150|nr:NAD-dependent epimerase/dehydratase family protein [Chloroflexota bacterium]